MISVEITWAGAVLLALFILSIRVSIKLIDLYFSKRMIGHKNEH
jgi:hypothetical protein